MKTAIVGAGEIRDTKVTIGTHFLSIDEPCLGLYEMVMQSTGSRGFHRYQIFKVIRDGDKIAEYQRDMGDSDQWEGVEQFRIPGGVQDEDTGRIYIEHTVGELIDIAEWLRGIRLFDKRELVGVDRIVSK